MSDLPIEDYYEWKEERNTQARGTKKKSIDDINDEYELSSLSKNEFFDVHHAWIFPVNGRNPSLMTCILEYFQSLSEVSISEEEI